MEIAYASNKLKKQLTQPSELAKAYGLLARKIHQRQEELKAADNLSIMKLFPAARCHELVGEHKGSLAVNVSGNYRMIFQVSHDPVPRKEGMLVWEAVSAITILGIEDYH